VKPIFEYIFNPHGMCGTWNCSQTGDILAYDPTQPKLGGWFCITCWDRYKDLPWLRVVLDRRPYIAPRLQIPRLAASLHSSWMPIR